MVYYIDRRGTVDCLRCPLSMDNEHQIQFNSKEEQINYFDTLHGNITTNYNLFKFNEKNYIEISSAYLDVFQCNYCRIQNTSIDNKYYYFFIEKVEIVNDNITRLYIKLDSYQTWQFDISFNKSFVERTSCEHIDSYNSLADCVSEGVLKEYKEVAFPFTGGYFVFCNADPSVDDSTTSTGVGFSIDDFTLPCSVLFYKESQKASLSMDLQLIANKGRGDRISSAVYVPFLADINGVNVTTTNNLPFTDGISSSDTVLKKTISFDFSNFNPKFKKALTFPYAMIQVQDLATGQSINLQPEKFDLDTSKVVEFEIQGSISECPYYKVIPKNYKEQEYSYSDALVIRCNTSLPVSNNSYAKYLMNNDMPNNLKMFGAGANLASSIVGKSPMGILSSFESVANVMIQEDNAKKQPNQLTAISDGALERMIFNNGLKIRLFTMDYDHMEMANGFWEMYGYPIKKLQYPLNIVQDGQTHQYVKVQDANISGDVPQDNLTDIINMFNKGVTLWKSDSFRKY